MKIVQVTPGVMPIPPNGWGAVEKIIWEYKLNLDLLGYPTEIKYTDDIKFEEDQIVHTHMANLAKILHSRGIPYVFSLHDHHVEHFGKESQCYRDNYEAIKNSKLTFVHSKHLIPYFDNLPNITYLPHGANLNDYQFTDRSDRVRKRKHRLVMMANNGVGGDPLSDRKGFLIGIESAKKLNLEITIICPSKSNKEFFDYHKPNYDKLNIKYDLTHLESINEMSQHDIFLHPSNLEAGHPNLTIVESVSMGIPVVGVLNSDTNLKGMLVVDRSVESFVYGIQKAIDTYDSMVQDCLNYRNNNSWELIVCRMVQEYKEAFNISEKSQLINSYLNVKKTHQDKLPNRGIVSNFKNGLAFLKLSIFSNGPNCVFKDKRTNRIMYTNIPDKMPSSWASANTPVNEFIDWRVEVKEGNKIIYQDDLRLNGNRVLLTLFSPINETLMGTCEKFERETGCYLTVKSPKLRNSTICFDKDADPDEFYFTLNEFQLLDYFKPKNKLEDKILLSMNSSALGDTIGFIPYAQKWAEGKGVKFDISISHSTIFDPKDYPNLNFIDAKSEINIKDYSDISRFEYYFDRPLQKGYSDQVGIDDFVEMRAKIKKVKGGRPIKSKYVCVGVQTTAQCKYWNYPDGWEILCKKLRKMGYTPVSLDMHELFGIQNMWNSVPNSCIKKLGMSFDDIILHLQHCEFFIGVSSGLSWLSWAIGKKVVMISGTTDPENEFKTDNIRIHNDKVCNGCFNKVNRYKFEPGDWMWCPVNKGTTKWFECTTSISPDDVMDKIINAGLIKVGNSMTI